MNKIWCFLSANGRLAAGFNGVLRCRPVDSNVYCRLIEIPTSAVSGQAAGVGDIAGVISIMRHMGAVALAPRRKTATKENVRGRGVGDSGTL